MATNIANLPPAGIRKAKQLVRKSVTDTLADSLEMTAYFKLSCNKWTITWKP